MTQIIFRGHEDPVLADIGLHFSEKVRLALVDTVDTCERAEIGRIDTVSMAMGVFLSEFLRAAYAINMNEKAFLSVCRQGFRGWKELHK